jgi:hypothetical protein
MSDPGVPLSHYPPHGVRGVLLDCIACGHHAELPLSSLVARFGADYGVRAIALHCRCSRCGSRNVESRPAWPSRAPGVRGRDLPSASPAHRLAECAAATLTC